MKKKVTPKDELYYHMEMSHNYCWTFLTVRTWLGLVIAHKSVHEDHQAAHKNMGMDAHGRV